MKTTSVLFRDLLSGLYAATIFWPDVPSLWMDSG